MRFKLTITLLALLLAAPVAWAVLATGDWATAPDGATPCSVVVPPSRGGMDAPTGGRHSTCYYDFASNQDSVGINVEKCANIRAELDPDEDSTNTGAEVFIRGHTEDPAASACSGGQVWFSDFNLDGVTDSTDAALTLDGSTIGRIAIAGPFPWRFVCIDVNAVAGTPDDARVTLTCSD